MRPKIEITIRGSKRSIQIEAIVDSGFEGQFCVPMDVASWVGAVTLGWGEMELADGNKVFVPTVACDVEMLGTMASVKAFITDAQDPIIGTKLLEGFLLTVDFDSGNVQLKRK
jgi:clan AA aspartic protease